MNGADRTTSDLTGEFLRRRRRLQCALVAVLSVMVYMPALSCGFVYDDMSQVLQNRWIRSLRHLPDIFGSSVWSFKTGYAVSNYYRPFMHTIYALNYLVFGLRPWGFHLVNVLFHAGVCVVVFFLLTELWNELEGTGSDPNRGRASREPGFLTPPLAAALLFATHPIHTEAVAWIAGLPEVSFSFFGLSSLYLYVTTSGTRDWRFWLAVLLYFVASLCKETALSLPLLMGAYEWLRHRPGIRAFLQRLLPFVAATAVYITLRMHALRGFAPEPRWPELTSFQHLLNAFPLFFKYLSALVVPVNLNAFHVLRPVLTLSDPRAWIGLAAAAAFGVTLALSARRNARVLYGLMMILAPLIPVLWIRFVGINAFAERYLYLPSVGVVFLCAAGWSAIPYHRARDFILLAVLALYSVGTFSRATVWHNNYTLFSDTVAKSPDSYIPQSFYANALWEKGDLDAAVQHYLIAISLDPQQTTARKNLGTIYLRKGLLNPAMEQYAAVLRLAPNDAEAHANMGILYDEMGWLKDAVSEYEISLKLDPGVAAVHNNLGVTCWKLGLARQAAAHFEAALQLEPGNPQYEKNLEMVHAR